MDAKTNIKANIKKRLPSRHVEGPECAPHRGPRDIVTRRSLENAAAVAESGGSTNAALHFAAIAHDVAKIFKKTPYVADLKPGGRDVAKDMFEIGGIPLLMKTLRGYAGVGSLNVKLTVAELAERKTKWKAPETNHMSGALWKYAQQVGPGGAHEKQCYADI